LDLPDVPTKAPVAPDVVTDDANVSAKSKGIALCCANYLFLASIQFQMLDAILDCNYGGTGVDLIVIISNRLRTSIGSSPSNMLVSVKILELG
jgi:hypothetical protein